MSTFLEPWQLRAAFARSLSDMYGTEVPAYTTLLDVSHEVNADFVARHGADAERLGSIARVTAERHGAIRVGTPTEMAQVARVFGAMGMRPVGFYDLRDASSSSVPVISTAFRPVDRDELARNPFRVFTSMLVTADRRFFTADLERRLESFLAARTLFGPELLALADRAEAEGGLPEEQATEFLRLATEAFELSREPVDQAWYRELEAVSAVAADIGGIASTHINHLTPRVLDIDDLYARMEARGITMIDAIQGPPRWEGPDVLLRQTSFRALAEPRTFRTPDGEIVRDALRVRFGEVEARGIALTREGRAAYDAAVVEIDEAAAAARADDPGFTEERRQEIARSVWARTFPTTEAALAEQGLGWFTYEADSATGTVRREPIVYEDFLPRSAAGIFQSNLTSDGAKDATQEATDRDADWMAGALGRDLDDPFDLYADQVDRSLAAAAETLGVDPATLTTTTGAMR
ncbi:2-oxoadipate dioxygenase/decarboxylase family protein [Promicromonospora thailandica]|uniref:2-oxoadipate dioxygenase/decarboxylase n=1 Tax=Promicromonospora thailandica TaxID=765201 RepID=A0A9X2JU46_9MICO|nr:VOC family protein [Promicromonospora thailandica]MCP2264135.1 putative metalloenzyme YdcJ, glyoxalase superfamily [Promicromonospora thailandica]BFF21201.1 VOC family protein [Promicromonospora thailandica]